MDGEKMFIEHFFVNLRSKGVTSLVLRSYRHDPGHSKDDPNKSVALFPATLDNVSGMHGRIFQECPNADRIAVTSLVRVDAKQRRLLLLDFAIPISFHNEVLVRTALRKAQKDFPKIFACGTLMRTANSYHYVGLTPLSHHLWQKGMGLSLLFGGHDTQLIDVRYIGHSLMRGYGALRVCDRDAFTIPTLCTFI